jgi:hypothetical protein
MKNLYICGDSFGYSDPEYGACWVDILIKKLSNWQVTNLSRVCASNLQISTQVDHAIKQKPDYIIYLMTTSTREDIPHTVASLKDMSQRYTNIADPSTDTDLTSYSIFSLDNTTILSDSQLKLLTEYHKNFFDLDVSIYKSKLICEATLQHLVDSNIPFVFDQGGFENTNFTGASSTAYFENYIAHKSAFNLWDYYTTKKHRPYYHIQDTDVHERVADYYYNLIS